MENNQNMEMQNLNGETVCAEMEKPSPASRKKQRLILAAVLVICMAIFATGTLAFFTAEETAHNVITTGMLEMKLIELTENNQPWPEEGVSGVMPGMEVVKIPYVKNTGGVDFWVRMSVSMKVIAEDGSELSDRYITLDIDDVNWTGQDGYYYYNSAVEPDGETEPLFTKVTFDPDMHNAYMNAKVEIDVHAEAVQSRNNGESALEAGGWTEAE